MPRPPIRRAPGRSGSAGTRGWVAALLVGLLACLGPAALGVPPQAQRADGDLLTVELEKISPVARAGGKVRISGTVTNTTPDTWTRVNLHPFGSQAPMLDSASLVAAAATDPADYVGGRVTTPGTFDTIDTLVPGQSAHFSVSLPVNELLGPQPEPGVYWIGIHALGDSSAPRDSIADGKARTFIPVLAGGRTRAQDRVPVSLVLPLRGPVWNAPDGRLQRTGRWLRALTEGGGYEAFLDTAEELPSGSYSLLVDPGILDAVSRLTQGNPSRSLLPDPTVPGQEPTTEPGPTDSATPSATSTITTLPATPAEALSDKELALATAAQAWMSRFLDLARAENIWTLPFGDVDISAASRHDSTVQTRATERAAWVMDRLGLYYNPAVMPTDSLLRPEAVAVTDPNSTVILGDIAFDVPPESSTVRVGDRRVLVTSSGAASGGPGPTSATAPLAMRQRLLSEAALRSAGAGKPDPIILPLPTDWSAEDASAFAQVLDQDWVTPATLSDLDYAGPEVPVESLVYSDQDAAAELTATNFAEAADLVAKGTVLEEVLTLQTTVERQVLDEALSTLSYQVRSRPRRASDSAAATAGELARQLASIQVLAPPAVTLSSDEGPIGTTLVNGLDQPVTVALSIENDDDITLGGTGARNLSPHSRTQAKLQARADRSGAHRVRLVVTSEGGTPLGSSTELPIRATQVSGLIWIAMAGGAVLLFGAIAVRLVRRVRSHGNEPDDDPSADPTADPTAESPQDDV